MLETTVRLSPPLLFAAAASFVIAAFFACSSTPCSPPDGIWEAEEGHLWVIQPDGKMLWITRFGSQLDTVHLSYHYRCSQMPATLDLHDFDGGPWQGKVLYGLFERTSDTSFRFCAAAGADPSARPAYFDQTETVRFFRKKP